MGADHSAFDQAILRPAPEALCATEPRFCLPHHVTLRLREKFWSFSGDDFKITDATSGVIFFQCHGKAFSLREKKVLRDNTGQPVLNLKEQLLTFTDKFKVFAGDDSSREICKFSSRLNFLKAKLSTVFTDPVSRKQHYVVLKGDWRDKKCVIYLGEPKQGGIPLAKIYRPLTGRSLLFGVDDYYLEVAPGFDIALAVIMCIALDEHANEGK